jgi:hypothetical protein
MVSWIILKGCKKQEKGLILKFKSAPTCQSLMRIQAMEPKIGEKVAEKVTWNLAEEAIEEVEISEMEEVTTTDSVEEEEEAEDKEEDTYKKMIDSAVTLSLEAIHMIISMKAQVGTEELEEQKKK